jgi:hypothetical protein
LQARNANTLHGFLNVAWLSQWVREGPKEWRVMVCMDCGMPAQLARRRRRPGVEDEQATAHDVIELAENGRPLFGDRVQSREAIVKTVADLQREVEYLEARKRSEV